MENDEKILKKYFNVISVTLKSEKHFNRKIFNILKNEKIDLIFIWFALHNFAPTIFFSKLFRIKTIVIAGGYDVAKVPEIGYGQFNYNRKKRFFARFVLKNADLILPVSNFTKNEILDKAKPKKYEVVYNGINTEIFKPAQIEKEKIVLTIGRVKRTTIKLKGLETFAKTSLHFPSYKFAIIGQIENDMVNELKKINPKLIFIGEIPHKKVINWLQRSEVYCQLSCRESFGMGVAEAMSCGCITIVTDVGALPEVLGDAGFYTKYGDEQATVEAVKKALNTSDELGEKSGARIKEKFSLQKREKKLVEIIKNLASR